MPSWAYRTMGNASYIQFDKWMQKKKLNFFCSSSYLPEKGKGKGRDLRQ